MSKDPLEDQVVGTREAAEELSEILGCSGAHKRENGWGPCESMSDLKRLIRMGNPAFREWKERQSKRKRQVKGLEYKAANKKDRFNSQDEASRRAQSMGCTGAHMVRQGVWAPCNTPEEYNAARGHSANGGSDALRRIPASKKRFVNPKKWEKLRERGIRGIETLPGGGLVSAKSASRSDSFKPTQGMIEDAQRGLDWRSEYGRGGTRIGIARARDIVNGRNLPYDTVKRMKAFFDRHQSDSDAEGFRPGEDGYPSNGRIAHALWGGDAGYAWSKDIVERVEGSRKKSAFVQIAEKAERGSDPKTPAKPSERISGSSVNKPGSASSGKNKIEISESIERSLQEKVRRHNKRMRKANKDHLTVSTGTLKAVWRRGTGAFSSTHRPGMTRQQWAMGRVNAFLKLVSSGKPSNPKYITDNDLLPKKHRRSTKK